MRKRDPNEQRRAELRRELAELDEAEKKRRRDYNEWLIYNETTWRGRFRRALQARQHYLATDGTGTIGFVTRLTPWPPDYDVEIWILRNGDVEIVYH